MSAAPATVPEDEERLSQAEDARREYRVPAAEKALDILEFMAARHEDVTQTELAAQLGRSIHEVYRIVQLLVRRGYLVRTPTDRYRLSLRLFELAHQHPPINRLIDSALPAMRSLVGRIDQSCHLAVLRDLQVLVVLQVESPLPMRYSVAMGALFPVLQTSSGAVLLACLPPDEQAALLERIVAAGEAEDTPDQVARRLRSVVESGHEVRPSLVVAGCTNLSLPVRDHFGRTIAALTVPYLQQRQARFSADAVLQEARAAARDISRALSAPNDGLGRQASPAQADDPESAGVETNNKAKTWRKR